MGGAPTVLDSVKEESHTRGEGTTARAGKNSLQGGTRAKENFVRAHRGETTRARPTASPWSAPDPRPRGAPPSACVQERLRLPSAPAPTRPAIPVAMRARVAGSGTPVTVDSIWRNDVSDAEPPAVMLRVSSVW